MSKRGEVMISVGIVAFLFVFGTLSPNTSAQSGVYFQKTWGGNKSEFGRAVAVDASGNIYVTGMTCSFSVASHPCQAYEALLLLKYDSTGTLIWQRTWSESANETAIGFGITLDSMGNIFIVGDTGSVTCYVPPPNCPIGTYLLLLKFDSSGNLVWQRTWSGIGVPSELIGRGVRLDALGNIFVWGYTTSSTLLLKLNSTGSLLWAESYGPWGGTNIDTDSNGNLYATGITTNTVCDPNCKPTPTPLLKFNSSGALLWQETWGGSQIGEADEGQSVAVDPSGNIYLTGETNGFGAGGKDAFILKFDSSGSLLWQKTWGGTGDDEAQSIAVDSRGMVHVVGYTNSFDAGYYDAFLLELDASGRLVSQKTWGGDSNDAAFGIALDSANNSIVTGFVNETPPYVWGSGNNTLGRPTFVTIMTSGQPQSAFINTRTPTGVVEMPTGSQTYAGELDVFLLKLPIIASPLPPNLGLVPMLALPVLWVMRRRKKRTIYRN